MPAVTIIRTAGKTEDGKMAKSLIAAMIGLTVAYLVTKFLERK